MLHYRVRILVIPSETPSPSSRRVAAIREAKDAFLAAGKDKNKQLNDGEPAGSTASSIGLVPSRDSPGNGSVSSFEHVSPDGKTSPKTTNQLNVFEKEFPIGDSVELRSPALLARVNSVQKPPRLSLERMVTVADVVAMQPLLLEAEVASGSGEEKPPAPPTSPMPKDEKVIAFAKSNVD